jgi:hypothetical protein
VIYDGKEKQGQEERQEEEINFLNTRSKFYFFQGIGGAFSALFPKTVKGLNNSAANVLQVL